MALVDFFGVGQTGFRQTEEAVPVDHQIAGVLQQMHRAADARLGEIHFLTHVYSAYRPVPPCQDEDRLQIHFAGFLKLHKLTTVSHM